MATPPESVIFPRSSPVVVSKKSTLPVGVPEPGAFAVTFAVIVTAWPNGSLVAEALAEVVLASGLIVRRGDV